MLINYPHSKIWQALWQDLVPRDSATPNLRPTLCWKMLAVMGHLKEQELSLL